MIMGYIYKRLSFCFLPLQYTLCLLFIGSGEASTQRLRTLTAYPPKAYTVIPNGCNITVDAGPDITICAGTGKQINGIVTGGYNSITWDPTDGLSNPNIANPVANPMSTTTYTLIARGTSGNLFLNGGFETGNIAPSTSAYTGYTNINSFAMSTGGYMVMSVPQIAAQFGCNPPIGAFTMAITPTSPSVNFLCQTIPVSTNTLYKIKWKCFGIPYIFGAPPVVELKINGNSVGTLDVASGLCVESDADFTWNSGTSSSANLCFSNIGGTGTFSMFSIDDIEFRECCEVKDEVKVTVYELIADIAMPDEINCNNAPLELDGSGSSSGPNIKYEWTTKDGKIDSGDKSNKAKVSTPGTYKLKVIGEFGCEKEVSVTVTGNTTPPDASATNTDIDCKNPQARIEAKSKKMMVMYEWSGPNGYSSTKPTNFDIREPGDYIVTVTDDYGCKSTAKVTVRDNRTEVFLELRGDTIQCGEDSVKLSASSVSPKPSFPWKHKDSIIAKTPVVTARDTGWYYITVTDSLGCFVSDSFRLLSFQSSVPIDILGGEINCRNSNVQLTLLTDTSGTTRWRGPAGFLSMQHQPTVRDSGWYYVEVTTAGGCKGIDSVYIPSNLALPSLQIDPLDTLSCNRSKVTIHAKSNTDVRLQWMGPGGFMSVDSIVNVSDSGEYIVIVEGLNGCLQSASVRVTQVLDTPALSLIADTLDCLRQSITFNVNNDDSNTFNWTGPGGFISNQRNPQITVPGEYIVTAVSKHGCARTGIINIAIDTTPPSIQIIADTISCLRRNIQPRLIADADINGYNWSGPGNFSSNLRNPNLNTPGIYILQVTNSHGCINKALLSVFADTLPPSASLSADDITCNKQAFLKIINSIGVSSLRWNGPSGFSSTQAGPQVTVPGWYYLTVISANGCSYTDSVQVIQKDVLPDLTTQDDTLTCANASLSLYADSKTAGVKYQWSGPNNFSSDSARPHITLPGVYTIKVIDPNGCELSKQVNILQFNTKANLILNNTDSLTCKFNQTSIKLTADQNAGKIVWTGPGNFTSNGTDIRVNNGGTYIVQFTNEYGCVTTDSIQIIDYRMLPTVQVADDSINCARRKIKLSLIALDPLLKFSWAGPGGFVSTDRNPDITGGGTYMVTITNAFNCEVIRSLTIKMDTTAPDLSLSADTLTCLRPTVPIKAGTSLQGFNIVWTGPNGYSSMFPQGIVKDAGLYTCTLTNPRSKCQTTATIVVQEDTNRIRSLQLDHADAACGLHNGSIQFVNITGGTPGYLYSIDNGLNFSDQNIFGNLTSGLYNLVVKDRNGCEFRLTQNIVNAPGVDISLPPSIDVQFEDGTPILLTIVSGNASKYFWSPSDQLSCSDCASPQIRANREQLLTVVVTDPNGCTDTASILIRVRTEVKVFVPTVFSPNGDGVNDYFFPKFTIQDVSVERMAVYDRWGEQVFARENFTASSEKDGWDGSARGKPLNPGVHVYLIQYREGQDIKILQGDLTLIR